MKILCFNDWIVERMKINPITRTELDKAKEVATQAIAQRDAQATQDEDYRSKKLRTLYDAATQYNRFIARMDFGYNKLEDDFNHTWYDRFEKWNSDLDSSALIKKHEQRSAKKNLSEIKRFVTMYCAFKMYGTKNDYTANKIIKTYMDSLKSLYTVDDKDIINAFFE